MRFADLKLREEEARGAKYLESSANSLVLLKECLVEHLVEHYMDQMLAECSSEYLAIRRDDHRGGLEMYDFFRSRSTETHDVNVSYFLQLSSKVTTLRN